MDYGWSPSCIWDLFRTRGGAHLAYGPGLSGLGVESILPMARGGAHPAYGVF